MRSTKSLKELPVPANGELSASPKKSLAIQADRLTNILGDPLLDVKADLLNALKHRDIGVILALQRSATSSKHAVSEEEAAQAAG